MYTHEEILRIKEENKRLKEQHYRVRLLLMGIKSGIENYLAVYAKRSEQEEFEDSKEGKLRGL